MEAKHPTHMVITAIVNGDAHGPRAAPTGHAIESKASGGVVGGGGKAAHPIEHCGVRRARGRARLGAVFAEIAEDAAEAARLRQAEGLLPCLYGFGARSIQGPYCTCSRKLGFAPLLKLPNRHWPTMHEPYNLQPQLYVPGAH